MPMKQPLPGEAWKKPILPLDDPEFRTNYPNVYAYISDHLWENGSIRQTATITIYVENGGMTLILNDRANLRSAFFQEASLFSCLAAAENALESGTVDWRVKRGHSNSPGFTPF